MSSKRRNSSSPECDIPNKRQRQEPAKSITRYDEFDNDSEEDEIDERPQIHASTGQAGAFPGLGGDDHDLFYGPAADGIDYLRMVRSEAKGIPSLLVARSIEDVKIQQRDVQEEDGGYWEEDAYIAIPQNKTVENGDSLPPAQLRYYQVLLAQYALVRATMRCVPPLSAIEKLTSSQAISFPPESKKARLTWNQCLRTQDPSPTQIACMDESSVFEVVRLVTMRMRGLFEKGDVEAAKRIGAWIWAILGKCPDRGEMSSEEISDLRQLARKALDVRDWIMKKNRPLQDLADEDEEKSNDSELEPGQSELDDIGNSDSIDSEVQAARLRLSADAAQPNHRNGTMNGTSDAVKGSTAQDDYLENQAAKHERLVILDMIITIVSEVYGQRDLLEFRIVWE